MDAAPVVTVVDPAGRSHVVNGWAARLIVKVLVCQGEINGAPNAQLVADWGPTRGMTLRWTNKEIGKEP